MTAHTGQTGYKGTEHSTPTPVGTRLRMWTRCTPCRRTVHILFTLRDTPAGALYIGPCPRCGRLYQPDPVKAWVPGITVTGTGAA